MSLKMGFSLNKIKVDNFHPVAKVIVHASIPLFDVVANNAEFVDFTVTIASKAAIIARHARIFRSCMRFTNGRVGLPLSVSCTAIATPCAVQFLPILSIDYRFAATAGCHYFINVAEKIASLTENEF